MKVITLAEDTIIEGQLCRKGQLVQVEDGFDTNVKKVVATAQDIKNREEEGKVKGERLKDKVKKDKLAIVKDNVKDNGKSK